MGWAGVLVNTGKHRDTGEGSWDNRSGGGGRKAAASQGTAETDRSWGEAGGSLSCRFRGRDGPASTLILDFQPPELRDNQLLLF